MGVVEGKETNAFRAILSERSVASVIALALFLNLGTGMVLPVLPLFAQSLGADYGQAGLMVAAFYFARLLSDVAAGWVLATLGIRRSAVAGLSLLALGAALTAVSPTFAVALVCWACSGFGAGTVFAAMYNALILGVPKQRMARALSLFYGAFNGGVVAGGFIGGVAAARFGLNVPLFCLAGIGVVLAIAMGRYLNASDPPRETPQTRASHVPTSQSLASHSSAAREGRRPGGARGPAGPPSTARGEGVLALFRIPGFGAAVIAVLANLWVFGAVFNTLTPLFARNVLQLSTAGIGVLFAIALAAEFLVYYPAGRWADTRGRRFVLMPSFAFLAIATMVLGWAQGAIIFAALLALVGFASGFAGVPPAAMLADVLPANRSAQGVATFRFGADVGYTLGPLVTGLTAASLGFKWAFIAAGIPCLLALLVVSLGRETLRLPQTA